MKFAWKIFFFVYCLVMITVGAGCFILINSIYKNDYNNAVTKALDDNKSMYAFVTSIYQVYDDTYISYGTKSFTDSLTNSDQSAYIGSFQSANEKYNIESMDKNAVVSHITTYNSQKCIQVVSRFESMYIVNTYNLTKVEERRLEFYHIYQIMVIIIATIMAIVSFIFSKRISKPIVMLTDAATAIADGDYDIIVPEDIRHMKSYEAVSLAKTLNIMSENTKDHIASLNSMIEKQEEFIANFTHEIKTPLTSIIGYGDLLRTYDVSPEKRREYGEYMYREGTRLEQLSFNLLDLIVMDKQTFEKVCVDTSAFFERIEKTTEFLSKKYSVEIKYNIHKSTIFIEPSLFSTAILNFIDNACKASQPATTITITGLLQADSYQISVADNGTGIAADQIKKITEPFYMVDKSRSRKLGGAGLGLALSKKIIGLHDAILTIESELGKGTTVTVSKISLQGKVDDNEKI